MQGNGLKIGLTLFFLVLSGYYLYPSVKAYVINQRLEAMTEEERAAYMEEHYDDIRQTQERALKLGLDLLGGMHVTLEVRVDELVRELATDTDATFDEVMEAARARSASGDVSFIQAFVQEFEARDPNARLSRYFRSDEAGINRRSTNEEVAAYLEQEANDAIDRAIEIIRQRVDRYGVTEPSIQKQGTRRIVVELPGIDDAERVRRLLRGTARLEFRLMADPAELTRVAQSIIEYYEAAADTAASDTSGAAGTGEADTAAADPLLAGADTSAGDAVLGDDPVGAGNPLLAVMQPLPYGPGVVFGQVLETDTAAVNRLLRNPEVQALIPDDIELMYTASPVGVDQNGREVYDILGVRSTAELTGEAIVEATVDFDQFTNQPQVSMTMDSEGARTWARVTGANVGKNIAIVLDGVVYSYPVVEGRIVGGRSRITGLDSREEAQDIVTVLESGALPAPVVIVEERTVGPSLGQASIRAGFWSVLVGLLLVALFMIWYYRTAGVVADLALLLNIVFILGILAAFGATLTLPGIAGIVLTIGMAVDANVLIFERIREEQGTGKTLKAAVEAGYAKALSAIVDANITTFFVGVILYSFGVGPIQGFAVTLMAGILCSMFTAIIVTRIIFDYMIIERRATVSYG